MSELEQQRSTLQQLQALHQGDAGDRLQSDAELLELYVEGGDRGAIEILIRRYAAMVASVCRLTVADQSSAEDAFQATFLVLLTSANRIRRRSSVAAWLHGVAYRSACRLRKKSRQAVDSHDGETVIAQTAVSEDPITQLARRMELEALDRELDRLPEKLRAPIVEHYLLGFTAPEIADRMELSVSAVEGRLRRGRRVLRVQLARRGISLSVLVAGASCFQQHLQAAEASAWAANFSQTYLAGSQAPVTGSSAANSAPPHVSSLVRGETTMLTTSMFKTGLAASAILIAGTWAALYSLGSDPLAVAETGTGTGTGLALAAPVESQSVLGQIVGSAPAQTAVPAPNKSDDSAAKKSVEWQRPETGEGDGPGWLAGGRSAVEAIERNRQVLSVILEDVSFNGQPLSVIAEGLSKETGVQFELAVAEMDQIGVDPDAQITLRATSASVREVLRRMLSPLDMTYIVTESTIEITSERAAAYHDNLRFYDLAFILPNSENADALLTAIQQSIDGDTWLAAGGTSSIAVVGSMMIISAPEPTHQKIEVLLHGISRMNPSNAAPPALRSTHMPGAVGGMGGMGGGMGGMGGGMGGMGTGNGGMGGMF